MTEVKEVETTDEQVSRVEQTVEALAREVHALGEDLDRHVQTLHKWGRMQNALIALLGERGVTGKHEVMERVYARLGQAGPKQPGEACKGAASAAASPCEGEQLPPIEG